MAMVVCAMWLVGSSSTPELLSTTTGQTLSVSLDDRSGSAILLDSASSLRLWKIGLTYYTELLRGRVSFDLRENRARHFQLWIGEVTVRDIGTVFDAAINDHQIIVTVERGLVQVEAPNYPTQWIHPNQQASIDVAVRTKTLTPEAVAQQISWRKKQLVSQADTVEAVVRELNAHNYIQIEILDDAIAKSSVGFAISKSNPRQFVIHLTCLHPELTLVRRKGPTGVPILSVQHSGTGKKRASVTDNCLDRGTQH